MEARFNIIIIVLPLFIILIDTTFIFIHVFIILKFRFWLENLQLFLEKFIWIHIIWSLFHFLILIIWWRVCIIIDSSMMLLYFIIVLSKTSSQFTITVIFSSIKISIIGNGVVKIWSLSHCTFITSSTISSVSMENIVLFIFNFCSLRSSFLLWNFLKLLWVFLICLV